MYNAFYLLISNVYANLWTKSIIHLIKFYPIKKIRSQSFESCHEKFKVTLIVIALFENTNFKDQIMRAHIIKSGTLSFILHHVLLALSVMGFGILYENSISLNRYCSVHYEKLFFSCLGTTTGLQIRVRIGKLISLFLIQNICCGCSNEPSH